MAIAQAHQLLQGPYRSLLIILILLDELQTIIVSLALLLLGKLGPNQALDKAAQGRA